MDPDRRAAYLDRLGLDPPEAPTRRALAELQAAHLHRVPFENLSIHLEEPIELEPDRLVDKLTRRRRGGFCYELNGAFAALLDGLGYDVEHRSARVFDEEQRAGPPFDHLVLAVRCPAEADDVAWLVDVGFGDGPLQPVPLHARGPVPDPTGSLDLVPAADGALDLRRDGRPLYRFGSTAYALEDFVPTCWWHRTSPDSHFTHRTVCTLRTRRGRVTITGRRLVLTVDGAQHERELDTDEDLLAAYREHFGLRLDRAPGA